MDWDFWVIGTQSVVYRRGLRVQAGIHPCLPRLFVLTKLKVTEWGPEKGPALLPGSDSNLEIRSSDPARTTSLVQNNKINLSVC